MEEKPGNTMFCYLTCEEKHTTLNNNKGSYEILFAKYLLCATQRYGKEVKVCRSRYDTLQIASSNVFALSFVQQQLSIVLNYVKALVIIQPRKETHVLLMQQFKTKLQGTL